MAYKKWVLKPRTETDLLTQLLRNRGVNTPEQVASFLKPQLTDLPDSLSFPGVAKALKRLETAREKNESIIVFGDYDVDGITSTAILWETLYKLNFTVMPYLPSREEGYSLNIESLTRFHNEGVTLIITVDCGITSVKEVAAAKEMGIDVIVTDHHQKPDNIPEAYALIHTTQMAGAGISWMFSDAIMHHFKETNAHHLLELAALGTIADLAPLTGSNRILVTHGLKKMRSSERLGLQVLIRDAGIDQEKIDTYEVTYLLAPRLNAMGRMHHAIDSLRLVCTQDLKQAVELAKKISSKNVERQELTGSTYDEAKHLAKGTLDDKIIIVKNTQWHEGIIGLVAGKLVEEFYRPTIVIHLGETVSRASARSIPGFDIVKNLRLLDEYFIDLGGHPMAAGFEIETTKLPAFEEKIKNIAAHTLTEEQLTPQIDIDAQLSFSEITSALIRDLNTLKPFGIGNSEPLFLLQDAEVYESKIVGKNESHIKYRLKQGNQIFDAIGFGLAERGKVVKRNEHIDIVFSLSEDTWNNQTKIQFKIKDFRYS